MFTAGRSPLFPIPFNSLLVDATMCWLLNIFTDEDGATAVEYAVMLALVLMAVIGAVGAMGSDAGGLWGDIDSDLASTPFGSGTPQID